MLATKILPDKLLSKLKSNPAVYSFLKRSFNACRQFLPKTSFKGLPGRIHPNDFMLKSYTVAGKTQYLEDSREQFGLMTEALSLANRTWSDVSAFLDLGSGYGRILRWATQEVAPGAITACDVNAQAVQFCRSEFHCQGIVTSPDFSVGDFQQYDLVFSCSVLTHLTEANTLRYFELVSKHAKPGAILVFSIHGEASIEVASEKVNAYLSTETIQNELAKTGFYYVPYPHYPDDQLGDTFFTTDYLKQLFEKHQLPISILSHKKGPVAAWLHDWLICQVG